MFLDSEGKILMTNVEAECVLGFSREDMQGKTVMELSMKTVRQDGSDFPFDEHPVFIALRTAQPEKGVVMGVFHPGNKSCPGSASTRFHCFVKVSRHLIGFL
ncbi:MAG: PAS domain S-box protein [Chlorobiaceae bacterium]|nr:PAS domain S-box protein [Chlorobiaceae bacterium]